jgi:hypothetical protein
MSKNKQHQALRHAVEDELRVHYTDPKQLKHRLAQCGQGMLIVDRFWCFKRYGSDRVHAVPGY